MRPTGNALLLPAPGAAARLESERLLDAIYKYVARCGRQLQPYQQSILFADTAVPSFRQFVGRIERRPAPITLPKIRGNTSSYFFVDELATSKPSLLDVLRARARLNPIPPVPMPELEDVFDVFAPCGGTLAAPITQSPDAIDDDTRAVLASINTDLAAGRGNFGYVPKNAAQRAAIGYSEIAGHHHCFFSPAERNRVLAYAEARLRLSLERGEWDTIVVCGASGTTVGSCLADRLGCDLFVVRKRYEGDGANSGTYLIGHDRPRTKFIFVDDLIASGDTANDLLKKMQGYRPTWRCAGYYLYADCIDDNAAHGAAKVPMLTGLPNYRFNP